MMPFDTKTMLILGLALGVVAFLIWSKFFKKQAEAPRQVIVAVPEEEIQQQQETNKEE